MISAFLDKLLHEGSPCLPEGMFSVGHSGSDTEVICLHIINEYKIKVSLISVGPVVVG
jgi:hypothetical protein